MKERLKKEATAYAKLDNIRKNIQFTSKTKIKISKSGVPSMLFGWAGAKPRQPHSNKREEARCALTSECIPLAWENIRTVTQARSRLRT